MRRRDEDVKYRLTLDKFTLGNYDGIEVENVLDRLLEKQHEKRRISRGKLAKSAAFIIIYNQSFLTSI